MQVGAILLIKALSVKGKEGQVLWIDFLQMQICIDPHKFELAEVEARCDQDLAIICKADQEFIEESIQGHAKQKALSHLAQGLAWLARKSSGMAMPVTAQRPPQSCSKRLR